MTDAVVVTAHSASGSPGAELAAWAAESLRAVGWHADGLYVATATAGRIEAVDFWRAAGDSGLAFANPRLFPWALANSPTGAIARALDVRGPTYTLVGGVDAVRGALEHAADDLADGAVTSAAVVALDVTETELGSVPSLVAVLVGCAEAGTWLEAIQLLDDQPPPRRAVDALGRAADKARFRLRPGGECAVKPTLRGEGMPEGGARRSISPPC